MKDQALPYTPKILLASSTFDVIFFKNKRASSKEFSIFSLPHLANTPT